MLKMFKRIKEFFLDALFPIRCIACNKYGQWLCENCQRKLRLQEKTAADYNLKIKFLDDIFIAGNYDEDRVLSQTIRYFKYNGIIELGSSLGRFLSFFWAGKLATLSLIDKELALKLENSLLVPIPLGKRRLQERGFNQAEVLTAYLAQEFSYEVYNVLKRKNIGAKRHQARLKKEKRIKGLQGIFYIEEKDIKKGRNFIIIDDVVTSGATLEEAAKVLKAAGVEKVYALVLAKG